MSFEGGKTFYEIEGVPFVIRPRCFLRKEEIKKVLEEIEKQRETGVILVPNAFDVIPLAKYSGRWIEKENLEYSGGGYTECSNCGQRYSWGAYFEVSGFKHCPRCGSKMEVDTE